MAPGRAPRVRRVWLPQGHDLVTLDRRGRGSEPRRSRRCSTVLRRHRRLERMDEQGNRWCGNQVVRTLPVRLSARLRFRLGFEVAVDLPCRWLALEVLRLLGQVAE